MTTFTDLIGLSLGQIMRALRNYQRKRIIQWETRNIALYEREIKNANKGIADCKKRLLAAHNSIE